MPRAGGPRPDSRARRALPLFAGPAALSFLLPFFLPFFLPCFFPLPAAAQDAAPEVLVASALGPLVLDGDFGLEAAAGAELRWSRLSVGLRGAELALVPGEAEPGFRWETLSNGQRRCRESATGRFAADTRCIDLDTAFGVSAEASWRVVGGRRPLHLGAGFRGGAGAGPYGTVAWRAVPGAGSDWILRGSAGPALLRLAVGLALSL